MPDMVGIAHPTITCIPSALMGEGQGEGETQRDSLFPNPLPFGEREKCSYRPRPPERCSTGAAPRLAPCPPAGLPPPARGCPPPARGADCPRPWPCPRLCPRPPPRF